MSTTTEIVDRGWTEIRQRFLTALRAAAEGGDTGAWSSGLHTLAGTDILNASTGRVYRGAFNRAVLAARVGMRLDRRVATARQLEKMGHPDPAAYGLAAHAVVLAPIPLHGQPTAEDDVTEEGHGRVVFRGAAVFSIDLLRGWTDANGRRPWAGLPPWRVEPGADWMTGQAALSLVGALCAAWSIPYEEGSFSGPHVALVGGQPWVRMPEPGMQEGSADVMLSNRLASFVHEAAHWTGFGGAGDALRRDMSGRFGSLAYAREELVAEITATRIAAALGLERSEGFLARQAAYVGGWAKPLLAGGADVDALLRTVCDDADRIVRHMLEALADHPVVVAAAAQAAQERAHNTIADAALACVSEIPDWRDGADLASLTPAQIERAQASFEAKRAKGAAGTADGFDAFVARSQTKRVRRGAGLESRRSRTAAAA